MKTSYAYRSVLLSLVFVVSALGAPSAVHAATISELTKTVASLTAQVAKLQAQVEAQKRAVFTVQASPTRTHPEASFDSRSYTIAAEYPAVQGHANVPEVAVIIVDINDVGLVAAKVPVVNGEWSYQSVVSLPTGYYTAYLYGGESVVSRSLHIVSK